MPLKYDDVPGSWGTYSEGWPETPWTIGKLLLCTKAEIVPYGSYVVIGGKQNRTGGTYGHSYYDYSDAVIRVETQALKERLEKVYDEMFVKCRHLLKEEFANG